MIHRTMDPAYESICTKLVSGDCTEAIAEMRVALAIDPNDGWLWELLGVGEWKMGSVKDSISSLETAMSLVPLGPEGLLALAFGYEVIQKRSLARNLFAYLASRSELPVGVLEPLAKGLGRADEPALALAVCQQATEAEPGAIGPLLGCVFYLSRLGESSRSMLPTLLKAYGLAPDNFSIRLLTARCLHDSGLSEKAAELLHYIDFESMRCASCLHAAYEILETVGDEQGRARALDALTQLAQWSEADC